MKKIIAIVFLFFLSLGEGFAQTEILQRLLAGQEHIFARNYDEAMSIFQNIMTEHPESAAGYFGVMAVLEVRMLERNDFHLAKEFEAAARQAERVVEKILAPYDPSLW